MTKQPDRHGSLDDLADAINLLTRPRENFEPYAKLVSGKHVPQRHRTAVASLIRQLERAVEPSGSVEAGHRVPSSTPSARLEAMDVLLEIDAESSQWLDVAGVVGRNTLTAALRGLVGAALQLDEAQRTRLAKNACQWVTRANVVTGWDSPAFRPHNTCPVCAAWMTLRIRVGEGFADALCVECRQTWDWNSVALLAEHIRSENHDVPYGIEETA